MDSEKNIINKIEYFSDQVEQIDEQIAELVSERLNINDNITDYIYKNNLDLKKSYSIDDRFKLCSNRADYINELLDYLNNLDAKRYKYISDKYNSDFGFVGDINNKNFNKYFYEDLTDKKYYNFYKEENLLESLLERPNFMGLYIGSEYSNEIIDYLDDVTDQVKDINEVNLVQFHNNKRYGFNTEYYGIIKLVRRNNINFKNKNVFILKDKENINTLDYAISSLSPKSVSIIDINDVNKEIATTSEIFINTVNFDTYDLDLSYIKDVKYIIDLSDSSYFSKLHIFANKNNIKYISSLYKKAFRIKKDIEIIFKKRIDDKICEEIVDRYLRKNLNIVLVGMPGAGKTTVGRKLSHLLNRKHFDLDKEFYKEYKITSADFLRNNSEKEFRKKESVIVERLSKYSNIILSTSGGVVNYDANYEHLKSNSIIFRIDRDLNKLSTKNRPLSEGGIDTLIKMLDDREEKYNMYTDYTVKNHGDFKAVAYKIKEIFDNIIFD